MSLNLASLQQKADQVIHNADEAIRKWQEFITAPAGTVQMQYYDQNGNLKTASFPNRNKVVNDFISNVNSAMNKTFYVDSINGNDANDGSSANPFKTLSKAINSVPLGGKGIIYLTAGQTYVIDNSIKVVNKVISIIGNNSNKPTIQGVSFSDSNYNYLYNLRLSGSSINLDNVKIVLPSKANSSLNWNSGAQASLFAGEHPAGVNFVRIGFSDIILPNDASYLCATGIGNWAIINHLLFEGCNITRDGGYVYLIQGGNGVGSLSVNNTALKNSAGTSLTWNDVLSGIVRDSNGVPRNVISNMVL